jgi:hypothetical protein
LASGWVGNLSFESGRGKTFPARFLKHTEGGIGWHTEKKCRLRIREERSSRDDLLKAQRAGML